MSHTPLTPRCPTCESVMVPVLRPEAATRLVPADCPVTLSCPHCGIPGVPALDGTAERRRR